MRIVALVPGGISDQALFFPTLDDLKRAYPNAEIDVVVEPGAKGAYSLFKGIGETIVFDFQANNSPADWANLLGALRDRNYSAALFAGRQVWGGFLLWLTGIPTRIGYANGLNTLFLTQAIPWQADQYPAIRYHQLLQGLGIDTPCPDLTLSIPRSDLDWADNEQKRLGIGGGGYVLLCSNSSFNSRNGRAEDSYPLASWQAIIQDFQQRQPELPLVLVQDDGREDWAVSLMQQFPALKLTAPDSISRLAAMIAGANLVLCTDSTAMHLAVALQVYTLALFGQTNPALVLPASDKFLGIQSPTGKLADLPPETVLAKLWGG